MRKQDTKLIKKGKCIKVITRKKIELADGIWAATGQMVMGWGRITLFSGCKY